MPFRSPSMRSESFSFIWHPKVCRKTSLCLVWNSSMAVPHAFIGGQKRSRTIVRFLGGPSQVAFGEVLVLRGLLRQGSRFRQAARGKPANRSVIWSMGLAFRWLGLHYPGRFHPELCLYSLSCRLCLGAGREKTNPDPVPLAVVLC